MDKYEFNLGFFKSYRIYFYLFSMWVFAFGVTIPILWLQIASLLGLILFALKIKPIIKDMMQEQYCMVVSYVLIVPSNKKNEAVETKLELIPDGSELSEDELIERMHQREDACGIHIFYYAPESEIILKREDIQLKDMNASLYRKRIQAARSVASTEETID